MNSKQKATLLLVLLLVVATSWFFRQQETTSDTAASSSGPDAYAQDVTIRVMNAAGQPVYLLRAERMAWFPNGNQLTLKRPQLDVTHTDGTLWQMNAEQGHTGNAGDPVWLTGEVIIQRVATTSQSPLKITTSAVMINPDARVAETEQDARIDGAGYRVETRGLTADFSDDRLELHSNVRGHLDGNS